MVLSNYNAKFHFLSVLVKKYLCKVFTCLSPETSTDHLFSFRSVKALQYNDGMERVKNDFHITLQNKKSV